MPTDHELFKTLESLGFVRLRWEEDPEPYDVMEGLVGSGEIQRLLDSEGLWGLVGEYRLNLDHEWSQGDAVWGIIGQPDDGCGYKDSIMSSTVAACRDAYNNLAQNVLALLLKKEN